jgi:hypothetical protein
MKHCSKCKTNRDVAEFYKNVKMRDGLSNYCKACQRAANTSWRDRNRDKHLGMVKDWYERNKEDYLEKRRQTYRDNPAPVAERTAIYKKKNLGKINARGAKRRAGARQRACLMTPADEQKIKALYGFARYLTEKFATPYHVDHIIPLNGKTCSGLHVPDNLRVIRARLNLSKGAKIDYELVPEAFRTEDWDVNAGN